MRLELRKELWNKFCSELVIAYLHHQQCITSRSHPAQRMAKKKKIPLKILILIKKNPQPIVENIKT